MTINFQNDAVKDAFDQFPGDARENLLIIREMIFKQDKDAQESSKWGQPSYVGSEGQGTAIRLGVSSKMSNTIGLYVHCGTMLISMIKDHFGNQFQYDGKRGVLFNLQEDLPFDAIDHIIHMAFHYKKLKTDYSGS